MSEARAMLRPVATLLACAMLASGAACGRLEGQPIVRSDAGQTTIGLGLVGYWKLDETGILDPVVDSSGGASNGTPINQPQPSTAVAPVRIANPGSRSFDGVNQLIDLGNPPALAFTGEVTLAAWAYLTAMPSGCAVVLAHGYRFAPSAELALRVSGGACEDDNGPLRWSAGVWDGTNHMAETSVLESDLNVWMHLGGTFDGRAWRLYKNGTEMSVHVYDQGASPIDAPWGIGGRAAVDLLDPRSFPGRLDEVRIYNRALSPSEILTLYHL